MSKCWIVHINLQHASHIIQSPIAIVSVYQFLMMTLQSYGKQSALPYVRFIQIAYTKTRYSFMHAIRIRNSLLIRSLYFTLSRSFPFLSVQQKFKSFSNWQRAQKFFAPYICSTNKNSIWFKYFSKKSTLMIKRENCSIK